ncbi:VOC family protein [Kribbella monticola]|uniref:VOC family protein n=1 Tax=Kribbella monticola TaxID=2185285 RepID=UPI000DD33E3E|nr:VOC family protein [Kribbella monticola]
MAVSYQLVIDCREPEPLARFWAEALHYVIEPPPEGFDSWDDFYRSIGVPEEELGIGADSIADPNGEGPRIWFQIVPDEKTVKNRIHIDVNASGGRGSSLDIRRERVDAEAARLVALGATRLNTLTEEGLDHYAVAMTDPEGNEFDIN